MSVRIASTIFKSRLCDPPVWHVSSAATDPDAAPADRFVIGAYESTGSFAEAVELAHRQRVELDRELMEDVHESRPRRRNLHTMEATA